MGATEHDRSTYDALALITQRFGRLVDTAIRCESELKRIADCLDAMDTRDADRV